MTERDWVNDIHEGDAREALAEMPESSVHMAMCSPPYYGLRDYDAEGQIGLEDSLAEYIDELVAVGEALKRVLRSDGSWWLNLGDSYGGSRGNHTTGDAVGGAPEADYHSRDATRLGRKNKLLVPHRVAIALQEAGWVVRNDATWAKPNPMPSSVKDRLNTTTEQVFHLTPNPDYWYDLDAIREPHAEVSKERIKHSLHQNHPEDSAVGVGKTETDEMGKRFAHPSGKNPGDVFEVTTKPFPDAHFAVYPPELCEKPIKATAPPTVCAECGSPYERETEVERSPGSSPGKGDGDVPVDAQVDGGHQRDGHDYTRSHISNIETVGWSPTCDCDTDATEAGIVLDPFAGAGTTCLVAKHLGRRFVGIDLNPEYVAMAQQRVGVTVDEPERLLAEDETALTSFTGGGDS